MNPKTFDCVEMKRRGAKRVYEATKGMTLEQEIEYWRKQNDKFQQWHAEVRRKARR